MAEFTFLKLQLDNASFPANAPLVDNSDTDDDWESRADEDEDSMSILPLLVGLVFLAGLAYAVKKFLGGDKEVEVEVEVDD